MTPGRNGWIVLALIAAASLGTCARPVFAEHPAEHMALHEKFYSTWYMPDAPHVSCCHNEDCKPAMAKFEGGNWWGRWSEQDPWTRIPDGKVEQNRDTPDGRAHMCGRMTAGGEVVVFCFVVGGAS